MNENKKMLQDLLSYIRNNEVLKNRLSNNNQMPENSMDTFYNDSIMEIDSDEDIKRELQPSVLFKRASLDETLTKASKKTRIQLIKFDKEGKERKLRLF